MLFGGYKKTLIGVVVFASAYICSSIATAQHPTQEQLTSQSRLCLEILDSSIIDFYLPKCVDKVHGGYLENLDREGNFTGGGKFLTLQSRQLWSFSTFAERGIKPSESLASAKIGFEFIQNHFFDKTHGGYYNQLNDDGSIKDGRKHAYLNSFALYGLVAYYRASGDETAIKAAMDLFEVLDTKAYDPMHGGYQEMFEGDWTPITDPKQRTLVGAVNTKTYNTHLHLMESFAELYRVTQNERVRIRLTELIFINLKTVQHPLFPCNIDAWNRDWTIVDKPDNLRASYGHDVECAWLVLDAARALGWSDDLLKSWAITLVDYSMKHGYDQEHGGFYYTGPLGEAATDRHKEWWVQAEAMVCMLKLYQMTGDTKYFTAFNQTFSFVKQYQISSDGGWWASRNEDGSENSNRSRTSMWQGAYHNGRALLKCAEILDHLAMP